MRFGIVITTEDARTRQEWECDSYEWKEGGLLLHRGRRLPHGNPQDVPITTIIVLRYFPTYIEIRGPYN